MILKVLFHDIILLREGLNPFALVLETMIAILLTVKPSFINSKSRHAMVKRIIMLNLCVSYHTNCYWGEFFGVLSIIYIIKAEWVHFIQQFPGVRSIFQIVRTEFPQSDILWNRFKISPSSQLLYIYIYICVCVCVCVRATVNRVLG